MKISHSIILLVLLSSCSLSKKIDKAKDILHDNRQDAAAFCMAEFPDNNTLIVSVDSSAYYESVKYLQDYADSILSESDARLKAINNLTEYIDAVEADGRYDAGMINELQAKLAAIKPVDVAKLRDNIEKQIRESIKPCKDTTIIQVPTKEIEYWKLENKKSIDRADKFEGKNGHKGKVIWWLIIYAIAMTVFAFRKIILKLFI
jgi:hypothetical protein